MTSRPTSSGMANGGVERDAAAQRVAHEVRLLEPEVLDEGRDVVGHQLDADRPVDVRRPPMPLQVDGDHLVALGERRQDRPEHLAGPEPAVEQDQGPPRAMRLVVEADPIDVGIPPGAFGLGGPFGGHGSAPVMGGWWLRYSSDRGGPHNSSVGRLALSHGDREDSVSPEARVSRSVAGAARP